MFTQYYGRSTSKICGHAKFYAILRSEYFECLRSCKIYAILQSEYFEGLRSCKIYAILRSEYFEGLRSCKIYAILRSEYFEGLRSCKFAQYYDRSTSKVGIRKFFTIGKYFKVFLRFIEVLCKFTNRKNINLLHYSPLRIPRYLVLLHDLLAEFIFLIITI